MIPCVVEYNSLIGEGYLNRVDCAFGNHLVIDTVPSPGGLVRSCLLTTANTCFLACNTLDQRIARSARIVDVSASVS